MHAPAGDTACPSGVNIITISSEPYAHKMYNVHTSSERKWRLIRSTIVHNAWPGGAVCWMLEDDIRGARCVHDDMLRIHDPLGGR